MMPFGEWGGKINQKRFLQTRRLRGKSFHRFFMTFNVDKTALRNSLWSRGTGSAWGQRGRTLQQGNLLGLNISKSKINRSLFLLGGWEETAHLGNAGGCIPQTCALEYQLRPVNDGQLNKASAEGQPLGWILLLFSGSSSRYVARKLAPLKWPVLVGPVLAPGGVWLLALHSHRETLLRHLDGWGSVGNSQHNIPGWIWDNLGLLNLICQPRTTNTWCFLPWVERWIWEDVGLMLSRGKQAGSRKTFPMCFQHRDGW